MGIYEDGKKLVENFCCIRDVYRNCRNMLLSCDPILADEKGFISYNWEATYGFNNNINYPDTWLPDWIIRQYKPVESSTDENLFDILTVGAIPWRTKLHEEFIPMCLASRMVTIGAPYEVFFLGVTHMFEINPKIDGSVYTFNGNLELFDDNQKDKFKEIVQNNQLISVAVPLLEITNTSQLFERVIDPILEHPWPAAL